MYRNINIDAQYFSCYIIQTLPHGGQRSLPLSATRSPRAAQLSVCPAARGISSLHSTHPSSSPSLARLSHDLRPRTLVPILLFTDHCSRTTVHCPCPLSPSNAALLDLPANVSVANKRFTAKLISSDATLIKNTGSSLLSTFKPANVQPALLS